MNVLCAHRPVTITRKQKCGCIVTELRGEASEHYELACKNKKHLRWDNNNRTGNGPVFTASIAAIQYALVPR